MNHKRPPLPVIVLLILVILVGGYFGMRALLNKGSTALTASGTIEAIEVTISPEIGGKVAEVSVDEGAPVKAGEVLFRLDDTLLQAQRAVAAASLDMANAAASTAAAALATAQIQYQVTFDAALAESAASRTSDWRLPNPAGYTLPGGYFTHSELITAAQAEMNAELNARDKALNTLDTLLADSASSDFVVAEQRLAEARAAFQVAQDILNRAALTNNPDLRDSAQATSDSASTELTDAQAAYDEIKETDPAQQIITARADLAAAQARFEAARDRLLALQTGENSVKVAAAQAVLHQAQAAADQAHLAVRQAEASLALMDTQIAKLTIIAPADGTILTRSIQPGEIVVPSASAMSLGRLDNLTITVYVPEDRYGEISLGQSATVTVDSFPGETFTATVSHIAGQAEFTPRNVQTIEGRTSTVFAIKLQVQDPDGKLKPGMPADVTFTR
ncbi:MAG: efflux RND transporter periplasmic adaptor subunit [Anaerolineales bacterium]|nr:efflux RND transporter periplasmic adaptor subunit [Anaerolineales bacterium]